MSPFSEFIINYDEEYSREYLWRIMRAAVTGEFGSFSRKERSNLVSFYEALDGLLSDVYKLSKAAEEPQKEEGGPAG